MTETLSHLEPNDAALIAPVAMDNWLNGNHNDALNLMSRAGYSRSRALAFFASYLGNENLYHQIWKYQNNYPKNAYKPETWQEQQARLAREKAEVKAREVLDTHAPILPEIPYFIGASTSGKGEIIIEVAKKTFEFSSEVDGVPLIVRVMPPEPEEARDELPEPQITPEELPATVDLANYLVTQVFADKLAELGYEHHRVVEDEKGGLTILINFSKTVELEWLGPFPVKIYRAEQDNATLSAVIKKGQQILSELFVSNSEVFNLTINPKVPGFKGRLVEALTTALSNNPGFSSMAATGAICVIDDLYSPDLRNYISNHPKTVLGRQRFVAQTHNDAGGIGADAWEISTDPTEENTFHCRYLGPMSSFAPRISRPEPEPTTYKDKTNIPVEVDIKAAEKKRARRTVLQAAAAHKTGR